MKKINLKHLLVAGLISSTTFAIADNFNERSFAAGVVAGAVLNNVFTADKYTNEPVYIYDNKYYYGGNYNYKNGYYYHNGVKLYGGRYYDQPRFYNNERYQVFNVDRYRNQPVYIHNGKYYYGGKYKHGRYYFNGYKLSGGIYYVYPRINHKYRFCNNERNMHENYKNNDRISRYDQDTRSYNDDREYREYDRNNPRYRDY